MQDLYPTKWGRAVAKDINILMFVRTKTLRQPRLVRRESWDLIAFWANDEIALEFNGYRNFVHNYKYDYRKIITD